MWEKSIERLESLAKHLDSAMPDVIAIQTMTEVMAEHKDRIFGKGLATDGSNIGEYSKTPGYFSKTDFIQESEFKQQGKKNKGKFKNGNERKSMFLTNGYSEFRAIQSRKNDKKNYKFSGDLEKSLNVVKIGDVVFYGTTNKDGSDKYNGLTEQSGKQVFPLSLDEKTQLIESTLEASRNQS
jgi:hypothetical protein